ncbi:conserved hypothetical protein [Rippkaea orientalis PCC 8801]|uniref:Myosin heavy chain n=1 Tax=Rippkaea orientalis (strain PCC 8801 / RF-1) TaxID=41431 RepID=B7K393_RIPO1|nr:hypothetical protein [Rippkaea orientalis]ACK64413.1 conserved hypothetical protein [Rippkaea orientalis PCC 8801]
MSETTVKETKEQIMSAFNQFLVQHKTGELKVFTKEEELEKEKNKQLLETASQYTVDNIVNQMASLQLSFGRIIQELSENLTTESSKLEELKTAIAVKKEQLKQLRQVRLVADAIYILRQEHQEKLRIVEQQTMQQREALEGEMEKTRLLWQVEQEEFSLKVAEETELITKKREQEVADYNYHIQRKRKLETDKYEETKRQQEREIQSSNIEKEKAWLERENLLSQQETEYQENQKKLEGFEEKLTEECNKAKGEAIKDAEREAKIKADLLEKEWELIKQGYDLKIQSLEAAIERNNQQITELITQLQTATNQAQNLALRAFQSSSNSVNS